MSSKHLVIEIIGPESSGKSTLTQQLSEFFEGICVEEYARIYLQDLDRPYHLQDVIVMAEEQQRLILQASRQNKMVVADTGLLNFYVWTWLKYATVPEGIIANWQRHLPDYYLLLSPDLEWEDDPLRENPDSNDRLYIFECFKTLLNQYQLPYSIVSGQGNLRFENAKNLIEKLTFERS